MKLYPKTVTAVFLKRPNRFLVVAKLQGQEVEAYLANPGRLLELLIPGCTLYLIPSPNPEAKQPWQAVAIEVEGEPVLLNTHQANHMAQWLINEGQVRELEGWRVLKREHKVGHSRFDLLLEKAGVQRLAEVKCVTLFSEKTAQFPDAPSKRAVKHLKELAQWAQQNPDAPKPLIIFLIQKKGLKQFLPDYHTDLEFAQTLLAVRPFLEILPLAVSLNIRMELSAKTELLPIPWEIIESEAKDKGSYLYLIKIDQPIEIPIGGLGVRGFPAGYYVYVGSAMNGVAKRLARHRLVRKKAHWHIDYLRRHAHHHHGLPILSTDQMECQLAQALDKLADLRFPSFGSSDCTCSSHLFGFFKDPLDLTAFWRLLFYFRTDRLF